MLSVFATTGLVLAALGLYGLVSLLVVLRTREIAVRMAIGATPGAVMKLVISDALRWTCIGVVIGTVLSIGVLRLLGGLLFDVKAQDARVFAAAIVVLVAVATLAAWLPGRRAARIDPMVALRCE